jgi:hypothetical protein
MRGTTMAKKVPKKPESREEGSPSPGQLQQVYPTIARWASAYGWVEFGIDGRDRPFVRAEDEGGTVWEGEGRYETLDEALAAMEAGLVEFLEEEGFNKGHGGSSKRKQLAASPNKPKPAKKTPPKAPAPPRHDNRAKPDTTPPVPRAIAEKVRKFDDIAEGLRRGQHFGITRLTSLKGLCKDPRAARSFALFLAGHARSMADEKKATERVKGLMDKAITQMESYLDNPAEERKERLYPLLRELEQEQDEYKRMSWGQVRIVHSMELVVVENALKSILRDHEAPFWLYQAARDYAERYDSRHGTGLIPSSAPMMREIADFWRGYYGMGR